jgi:hypothetical protein
VKLTEYEAAQVREIASWKSRPPNAFAEFARRITQPGTNLVEKVVPSRLVRAAIEQCFELAERLTTKEDLKRQARVKTLEELRTKPLEICDGLANEIEVVSQVIATAQGAITGAGGFLTTLIDVPLLFVLSLRTILKVGHCYGYPLDKKSDRHFVLGALIAAISGTLDTNKKRLDELHELEDLLIEETQEDILADELLSVVFQLEVFDGIPGIGTISGGLLNLAFMRRVDRTARRVFQERWLRDNGKVRSIAPAEPAHARDQIMGWRGTLRRALHSGSYAVGFSVALPVCVVGSLLGEAERALMSGRKPVAIAQ